MTVHPGRQGGKTDVGRIDIFLFFPMRNNRNVFVKLTGLLNLFSDHDIHIAYRCIYRHGSRNRILHIGYQPFIAADILRVFNRLELIAIKTVQSAVKFNDVVQRS